MREQDYGEFVALLDAAYDLIGSGQNKTISPQAKALFFKALGQYSIEQFRVGLNGHCMDKQRGRFTPKPADIIEQIEGATGGDGRPSDDEAWAIALTSQDEADTVIWTTEIAEAYGIAQTVMATGDKVGARMAFKDAYSRLVTSARQSGHKVNWVASLGWDKTRQAEVLKKAVTAGLLPAPMATVLLPNYSQDPQEATECPEGLKRVKEEMAKLVEKREQRAAEWEREKQEARDAEAERKRVLAEQAASMEKV